MAKSHSTPSNSTICELSAVWSEQDICTWCPSTISSVTMSTDLANIWGKDLYDCILADLSPEAMQTCFFIHVFAWQNLCCSTRIETPHFSSVFWCYLQFQWQWWKHITYKWSSRNVLTLFNLQIWSNKTACFSVQKKPRDQVKFLDTHCTVWCWYTVIFITTKRKRKAWLPGHFNKLVYMSRKQLSEQITSEECSDEINIQTTEVKVVCIHITQ